MKIKIFFGGLILVLVCSSVVFAKQELMLSKEQMFDSGPALDRHPFSSDCEALYYVDLKEDVEDMRRDFRNYFCPGMFTLTLDGPPGTTLTLFGSFFFGKERGFLVLKKRDDRKVWILHLEDFPDEQWFTSEATNKSGGYEAYYYPAPNFRRNVSSLKWGQWWEGTDPAESEVGVK